MVGIKDKLRDFQGAQLMGYGNRLPALNIIENIAEGGVKERVSHLLPRLTGLDNNDDEYSLTLDEAKSYLKHDYLRESYCITLASIVGSKASSWANLFDNMADEVISSLTLFSNIAKFETSGDNYDQVMGLITQIKDKYSLTYCVKTLAMISTAELAESKVSDYDIEALSKKESCSKEGGAIQDMVLKSDLRQQSITSHEKIEDEYEDEVDQVTYRIDSVFPVLRGVKEKSDSGFSPEISFEEAKIFLADSNLRESFLKGLASLEAILSVNGYLNSCFKEKQAGMDVISSLTLFKAVALKGIASVRTIDQDRIIYNDIVNRIGEVIKGFGKQECVMTNSLLESMISGRGSRPQSKNQGFCTSKMAEDKGQVEKYNDYKIVEETGLSYLLELLPESGTIKFEGYTIRTGNCSIDVKDPDGKNIEISDLPNNIIENLAMKLSKKQESQNRFR